MAQRALHERLGRHAAVLSQQILLHRPAVDADADGDPPLAARVGHRAHPLGRADVAGVDADLVHPLPRALERKLIVKMNVRDQRDVDGAFDLASFLRRRHIRHSHTDNLAPGLLQPEDLRDGRRRVLGVRVAHGLDRNRRAAAHGHLPHMDLLAHFVTFI